MQRYSKFLADTFKKYTGSAANDIHLVKFANTCTCNGISNKRYHTKAPRTTPRHGKHTFQLRMQARDARSQTLTSRLCPAAKRKRASWDSASAVITSESPSMGSPIAAASAEDTSRTSPPQAHARNASSSAAASPSPPEERPSANGPPV
jgi:hypothetical protein